MKIEDEIQQKKFKNIHHKVVINLIYTANWLQGRQQVFFKQFGITGQQFNILRILKGQHPRTLSATEIKSRMLDRNSDVSRLLDRLERKQLIIKKTCMADKRATDVFITDKGLELLNAIDAKHRQIDHAETLTESEAQQLSDLLDKFRG